jgi:hypothetical protein
MVVCLLASSSPFFPSQRGFFCIYVCMIIHVTAETGPLAVRGYVERRWCFALRRLGHGCGWGVCRVVLYLCVVWRVV